MIKAYLHDLDVMNAHTRAYIELHIAVILFGFTAILGKAILLSALVIVWWRVLLTSGSLLFFQTVRQELKTLSRQKILIYCGIGLLVGFHWLTFYGSIKIANASIALISFATTSFFTSWLEPLLLKRPFKWIELILGLLIIPGMLLIVGTLGGSHITGLLVGILSALLATIFTILNKKHIKGASSKTITFIELLSAFGLMSVIVLGQLLLGDPIEFWPSLDDFLYLIVLALLCTTLAYVLALRSLEHISAFAANLAVNLEPVYGIVLAWLIFDEHNELAANFYYGVLLIMLIVFAHPFLSRTFDKSSS